VCNARLLLTSSAPVPVPVAMMCCVVCIRCVCTGKHTYLSSGCLYISYGASVSAATACTGTLFALAHTYHRVCIIVVGRCWSGLFVSDDECGVSYQLGST
jgi:hypothetical protein